MAFGNLDHRVDRIGIQKSTTFGAESRRIRDSRLGSRSDEKIRATNQRMIDPRLKDTSEKIVPD